MYQVNLLTLLEGYVEASPGRLLPAKVATTLMELYLHKYSVIAQHIRSLSETGEGSPGGWVGEVGVLFLVCVCGNKFSFLYCEREFIRRERSFILTTAYTSHQNCTNT